jgi:hypothetical protein
MKKLLAIALLTGILFFPGCGSDKSTQAPVPPDDAPPLAPSGVVLQVEGGDHVVVTWSPNTEPDLAGYRAYVYDPDPRQNGSYVLQNPDELITTETWSCPIQYDQVLWVRLTAVDTHGNESGMTRQHRVAWEPPPAELPTSLPPAKPPGQGTDQERPTGKGN